MDGKIDFEIGFFITHLQNISFLVVRIIIPKSPLCNICRAAAIN